MLIGYRNIPVSGYTSSGYRSVVIGITYLRSGLCLEYLEEWINPSIQLDKTMREVLITQAKGRLINQLRLHLERYPDQPREWKGVEYG